MALSRVKIWGNEILTATDLNAEFNNILSNASSLISPLSGSLDWDGFAHTLDAAGVTSAQSSSAIGWSFIPGSKAGTPSATGSVANWAANTTTDSNTALSGTATLWTAHSFQRPTLAATNASVTTTDAATVYIANAPLAGSNETITNPWALWVDDGAVRFDSTLRVDGLLTMTATIASQAEVDAGTSAVKVLVPSLNRLSLGTPQTTTSGASVSFTGIPTGTRRITFNMVGVSLNNVANILLQIGDAGGIESSGYLGSATRGTNSVSNTSGFIVTSTTAAASVYHGTITLTLVNAAAFTWVSAGVLGETGSGETCLSGGSKSLSQELDRLTLTMVGGSDSFDAGSVNIQYER